MRRHFEIVEEELRNRLLHMGSLVEEMIYLATEALLERRGELLEKIHHSEKEVNQLHIEIDDRCLKLIALHQPTAQDLRLIMAAVKINSDLERVGDQAVNIAQNTEVLLKGGRICKKFFDIPRMVEVAKAMLKESLDAFVRKDVAAAGAVMKRDAEEDRLKSHAFEELMQVMQSDPTLVQQALGLLLITRNLERIADHATNIAEDVIFMVLGKDIRHHQADEVVDKI